MQRIFLESNQIRKSFAILDDDVYHHLFNVCRVNVNSKIELVVDQKRLLIVKIESIEKDGFNFIVSDQFNLIQNRTNSVHILQALPKQDKLSFVSKLCTEIGVSNIYPIISDYCDVKILSDSKIKRIHATIHSSSKQSKQMSIPNFHSINSLDAQLKLINFSSHSLCLIAHESSTKKLSDLITKNIFDDIYIAIGPEGGFSSNDLDTLYSFEFKDFSLGSSILRTEHAAFAAINYIDGYLSNFPKCGV